MSRVLDVVSSTFAALFLTLSLIGVAALASASRADEPLNNNQCSTCHGCFPCGLTACQDWQAKICCDCAVDYLLYDCDPSGFPPTWECVP